MTRSSHHILTAVLAIVLVTAPHVASAQAMVQAVPGTTDADRLADTMRQLATNPRNVDALVRAGELSLGLGDLSGAAALFARAEKVDPRNGRMKAGMASILVRSERPGEALRYFAQAEAFGLQSRYFATDRGLAYDLIGEQDRAQRDYRVALRDAPDDETIRRYALSLGISGNRELALKQLDPLVLKKDRGAWRARAFILAMNNDVKGAETIVTTMMPGAAAQGLLPFFQRLPTLTPADRAFAVHFGEVHTTPERIADARMTPPLPALGVDPTAPVMLAAVQSQATRAAPVVEKASGRRDRTTPGRVAMAAATTAVPATIVARSVQPARTTVAAASVATVQPRVSASVAPATAVAAVPSSPASTGTLRQSTAAQMAALPASSGGTPAGTPIVSRAGATLVATPAPVLAATGFTPTAQAAPGFTSTTPVTVVPTTPAPVQVAAVTTAPPAARAMAASEDTILARIIAGLSIPASELGVAPPVRATPVAAAPAVDDGVRVLAEAKAKADRDAAAEKIAADKIAADKIAAEKVAADAKLARAKLAADKKIADRKAIADKKALAEKKAAAAAKLLADKEAAEEKRIARANPERIWVQVSTGATEGDLPKAWKGVKAKAPTAFGSRGGWTTPWKATNRVLAGPFKTQAEARTFVNALAKEGVSTFSFTSDPGQVITKLPAK